MSLIAKQEGDSFPPIEAGNYQAVCYGVVDLGTQYNEYFGKVSHRIIIIWEIPELTIEVEEKDVPVERHRVISKEYTLSLHEKSNLYRDLVSWRGKEFTPEELDGFDMMHILGANCLLQIINTEKNKKTYANVAAVAKLLKNMPDLAAENEELKYSMVEDLRNIPDKLPNWIKDKIKASKEYKAVESAGHNAALSAAQQGAQNNRPDDIPF